MIDNSIRCAVVSTSAFIFAAMSLPDCGVLELCKRSKMPSSRAANSAFDSQKAKIRYFILSGIDGGTTVSFLL